MSQIFDALLRAERERAGSNSTAQTEAPDFLRHVERQSMPQLVVDHQLDYGKENSVEEAAPSRVRAASVITDNADEYAAVRLFPGKSQDALSQFQTLSAIISPNSRLVTLTEADSPSAEAFRLLSVRLRDIRQSRPLSESLLPARLRRKGRARRRPISLMLLRSMAEKKCCWSRGICAGLRLRTYSA